MTYEFESLIFPGVRGSPKGTISSPVPMTATLGFLITLILLFPTEAITPTSTGSMTLPVCKTVLPDLISSPARLMCLSFFVSTNILTSSLSYRASSIGTTVSAPPGIGAPVITFIAVPGITVLSETVPAGWSSMIFRTAGLSSVAPLVSSKRIAKPSIAELSKGGMSSKDDISSSRTKPTD